MTSLLAAAETAPIVSLLAALAVVLAVGRLVGAVFVRLGQPIVIGEIVAGIALGPSLLGLLPGDLDQRLFPSDILPYLKVVAQLGIVLFMFVIGLELDLGVVRRSGRRAVVISLSSIALPLLLGAAVVSPMLFDRYPPAPRSDGTTVNLLPFALFVGVSMCGTAFAILARILAERDMFKIPLGAMLVACAAIDDVVAFTLLAVATAVAGGSGFGGLVATLLQLVLIIAVLVVAVRPLLQRWVVRPYTATGHFGAEQMAIVFLFLMATSWATARIGISELIGAFLFGAMMPREALRPGREPGLFPAIAGRLEGVSVQLLLPVFFVVAGQGVVINGLGVGDLLPALAILGAAFVGKFGGGFAASRAMGIPRRQALAVGTMMNTRGLAELVILGIARSSGVISAEVYTMLVIMAVLTTTMSGPLLRWVYPERALRRDIIDAERSGAGGATDRVVVLVDDPASIAPLTDVAIAFGGARPTTAVTLVRFVPRDAGFAAVAEAITELQTQRRRCEASGVVCTVISRPSAQPEADLIAEVRRLAPDAVVLAAAASGVAPSLTAEGADVVIVSGPLDVAAGMSTVGGNSPDELAALEVAARLALHGDVPLEVTGAGRRVRRELARLGLRPGRAGVAVAAYPMAGPICVAAGERDRVSLYERLGPWRLGEAVTPLSSR
jgi:Kef-type K+ transport system membrane component KefB